MGRVYEEKHGYIVPPPPRSAAVLYHLRWLIPALATTLIVASLPEWRLDSASPVVTRTTGTLQGDPDSLVRLRQVEIAFHKALTEKQLDVMLSLFADDAVITASGVAYSGRDSLRQFWQAAPPFGAVGHWVSYGPAFRDTTAVTGDRAHMYFECLYIDADTSTIAGHTAVDGTLKNTAAGWVFEALHTSTIYRF
jgi:hypothetical protein